MFENLFQKSSAYKNIIFFIIAILFLVFIAKIKDIAILFFASYVMACSLNPLVDALSKRFKRSIAAAIVILITVLILGSFFIPIVAMAAHEIKSFVEHIPQYLGYLKDFISTAPFINKSQLAQFDLADFISSTSGFTTNFVNKSINISVNFASAMIYLLAAIIIIYYFMADKEEVKKNIYESFPFSIKR